MKHATARRRKRRPFQIQSLETRRPLAADATMSPCIAEDGQAPVAVIGPIDMLDEPLSATAAVIDPPAEHATVSAAAAEGEDQAMPSIVARVISPLVVGQTLSPDLLDLSVDTATPGTFAVDFDGETMVQSTGVFALITFTPEETAAMPVVTTFAFPVDGRLDFTGPGQTIDVDFSSRPQVFRNDVAFEIVDVPSLTDLRIEGLPTATVLKLGTLPTHDSFAMIYIGGASIDTIRFAPNVDRADLGSGSRVTLQDIEAVTFESTSPTTLRIDSASLAIADRDGDGLVVLGDDVALDLIDADQFTLSDPVEFAGETLANLTTINSGLSVSVRSGWHNPIDANDVDGNGVVEPLDALLIINELRAVNFHDENSGQLQSLESNSFPGRYFDTTDENILRPIDVLQVINQLRREQLEAEPIAIDEIRARTLDAIDDVRTNVD